MALKKEIMYLDYNIKKKYVCRDRILILDNDFLRSLNFSTNHGFSLYKGALVVWDEDHDPRVLEAVDRIIQKSGTIEGVVILQEHEGCLIVASSYPVFLGHEINVGNDNWSIENKDLGGY